MYVWVIHIFHTKNLKIRSKNAIHANLQLEDNTILAFRKKNPDFHYLGKREQENLFSYENSFTN